MSPRCGRPGVFGGEPAGDANDWQVSQRSLVRSPRPQRHRRSAGSRVERSRSAIHEPGPRGRGSWIELREVAQRIVTTMSTSIGFVRGHPLMHAVVRCAA
jgi:hypothetical protein